MNTTIKNATKFLHLLWAGFWSTFLLWFSFRHINGSFTLEPHLLAIPGLAALWLMFAFGLLFNRVWAWYGSFGLTIVSLFAAFYLAYVALAMATEDHRSSFILELVGVVFATVVVGFLVRTRHQFLRSNDQRSSESKSKPSLSKAIARVVLGLGVFSRWALCFRTSRALRCLPQ